MTLLFDDDDEDDDAEAKLRPLGVAPVDAAAAAAAVTELFFFLTAAVAAGPDAAEVETFLAALCLFILVFMTAGFFVGGLGFSTTLSSAFSSEDSEDERLDSEAEASGGRGHFFSAENDDTSACNEDGANAK